MINRILLLTVVLFSATSFSQILSFDEVKFELGDIDDLSPISREVHYKNTGDKELSIKRIKTSCGCTTSKLEKKVLLPSESGTLTVTFDPAGKKGKQIKNITFISNDINDKNKIISFTANIIPVINLAPKRIEFELDQSGKGYEKNEEMFVIENLGKDPIIIKSITGNSENFIVKDPKITTVEVGGKLNISVSIKPGFIPDKYTSTNIKVNVKIGEQSATRSVRVVAMPLLVSQK